MNNLERIYREVAKELKIDSKIVKDLYTSYWRAIREYISSLDYKEGLTEKEFNEIKTNVNIPALGKLFCTYETYLNTLKMKDYVKSKESQTNI